MFTSVFTKDDSSELPDMGPSQHPDLQELEIDRNGVEKLMKNLNPYKASGPDDLPAHAKRILQHSIRSTVSPIPSICTAGKNPK